MNKGATNKVLCFLFTRVIEIIEIIKLNSVFYSKQVVIETGLIKTGFMFLCFLIRL